MNPKDNREITVAVLPFKILGERQRLSPIVLGLTEDLTINFSKFLGLSVISSYSTQHIQDPGQNAKIQQLGADYLVTGSVRAAGEKLRITAQLIRTEDHKLVFARQYDETLPAIFTTQDDITQQIVSILRQQIDYDLLSYSYRKENVQLAAYENWLLGMQTLKKGSAESDLEARRYFEAALEIDPGFARAYTGISLSYFNEWSCQLWDRWDVSRKGAHKYALKALELDEQDYVSLAVAGRTCLFTEKYEKAEHYIRKALRMNPNDADNLLQIAFSMMFLGYPEEAVKLYERAVTLNPFHPDFYFAYGSNFYFELGDFDKSIELGRKVDVNTVWTDFGAYLAAAHYFLSNESDMWNYWNIFLGRFEQSIYSGKEPLLTAAITWQKNINPYRGKTYLEGFWNYMLGQKYHSRHTPAPSIASPPPASFIYKGELWELTFKDQTVLVKDAKGLHDIAKLLDCPEKEIYCLELMGSPLEHHHAAVTLDAKARAEYQDRIRQLQAALAEAEDSNDTEVAARHRQEYEELLQHLSESLGLGGRPRKLGSGVEKARSAVTWRIRNAIKKIGKMHPALAKHLTSSIKTGTFCCYRPEEAMHWILTED